MLFIYYCYFICTVSYATAVTVSCTVALGMRKMVDTVFSGMSHAVKHTLRMV